MARHRPHLHLDASWSGRGPGEPVVQTRFFYERTPAVAAMFRSLVHPEYRRWYAGALLTNIATWSQNTTFSWVVLTQLTATDAAAVGIVFAAQFAPQLALVSVAGWIADRFPRRTVLMCTQAALFTLGIIIAAVFLSGNAVLWHIYMFAALFGAVNAIDVPSRQAYVSDLVPLQDLPNAIALNSAAFNGARLIGPGLSGILIAVVGSGWVFVFNAVAYLVLFLVLHTLPARPPAWKGTVAGAEKVGLAEGFRYSRGRSDLLVLFVIAFLIGTFGMNFPIVSSTITVELGGDAAEFGFLSTMLGVGSLIGSLLAARRGEAKLVVMVAAVGVFGVCYALASVAPNFVTLALLLLPLGVALITFLTTANGYVQMTTAPHLRGRVLAIYMAILSGGTPIGSPLVGLIADTYGPRWAMGVAAAAGMLSFAIGAVWLLRRRRSS